MHAGFVACRSVIGAEAWGLIGPIEWLQVMM